MYLIHSSWSCRANYGSDSSPSSRLPPNSLLIRHCEECRGHPAGCCRPNKLIQGSLHEWRKSQNSSYCVDDAAGGTDACNLVSLAAAKALLPGASACEQQDSADAMFDLSRSLDNIDMKSSAYIYAMRPGDSASSFSLAPPVPRFFRQTHRQLLVAREYPVDCRGRERDLALRGRPFLFRAPVDPWNTRRVVDSFQHWCMTSRSD